MDIHTTWILYHLEYDESSCLNTTRGYEEYKAFMISTNNRPVNKAQFKELVLQALPGVITQRLGKRTFSRECFVHLRKQELSQQVRELEVQILDSPPNCEEMRASFCRNPNLYLRIREEVPPQGYTSRLMRWIRQWMM